ncbi:hypothetical protein B0I37DRAFT_230545 [Chaetomium sp. MPI-CAGE-AT-0009]|nr:hypothetical protein B0I37DRAFT_230545 [Chaetomium sp. MPI-CAGE-AT-0009]
MVGVGVGVGVGVVSWGWWPALFFFPFSFLPFPQCGNHFDALRYSHEVFGWCWYGLLCCVCRHFNLASKSAGSLPRICQSHQHGVTNTKLPVCCAPFENGILSRRIVQHQITRTKEEHEDRYEVRR